jgi:hypothetical protein
VWNTGSSGIAVWGRPWGADPAECDYVCVTDILVEGNVVERSNNVKLGGGSNEHITIASGVRRIEVRGNLVQPGAMPPEGYETAAGGEGIDLKEGVTDAWVHHNTVTHLARARYAIYVDGGGSTWSYPETYKSTPGWTRNVHISDNVVIGNGQHGIGITSEGSGHIDGVFVYRNLVSGNGMDGILVYDWNLPMRARAPHPLPTARNICVFDNRSYANSMSSTRFGDVAIDHRFAQGLSVEVFAPAGVAVKVRRVRMMPGTVVVERAAAQASEGSPGSCTAFRGPPPAM